MALPCSRLAGSGFQNNEHKKAEDRASALMEKITITTHKTFNITG
jgi:hypothetical protein